MIWFDLEITKTNILSKIHDDCFKNVKPRVLTRFSSDLPVDLVFDPKCTSFKLNIEIIKFIHDDFLKNITSGVLTRFCFDLVW